MGDLGSDLALSLTSDMLWTAAFIAAPLIAVTTLAGLLVSVLQVVTQIQEMSLTFIPKIITVVVVMFVFGPWMLKKLLGYSAGVIGNIPGYF